MMMASTRAQLRSGSFHFTGENERVHGDESFHAVAVEVFHEFFEICLDEIIGTQPGVELRQSKVNGIGPGGDCGTSAVPITGGREEFRSDGGSKRCHGANEA
jgi:hypothetical protein